MADRGPNSPADDPTTPRLPELDRRLGSSFEVAYLFADLSRRRRLAAEVAMADLAVGVADLDIEFGGRFVQLTLGLPAPEFRRAVLTVAADDPGFLGPVDTVLSEAARIARRDGSDVEANHVLMAIGRSPAFTVLLGRPNDQSHRLRSARRRFRLAPALAMAALALALFIVARLERAFLDASLQQAPVAWLILGPPVAWVAVLVLTAAVRVLAARALGTRVGWVDLGSGPVLWTVIVAGTGIGIRCIPFLDRLDGSVSGGAGCRVRAAVSRIAGYLTLFSTGSLAVTLRPVATVGIDVTEVPFNPASGIWNAVAATTIVALGARLVAEVIPRLPRDRVYVDAPTERRPLRHTEATGPTGDQGLSDESVAALTRSRVAFSERRFDDAIVELRVLEPVCSGDLLATIRNDLAWALMLVHGEEAGAEASHLANAAIEQCGDRPSEAFRSTAGLAAILLGDHATGLAMQPDPDQLNTRDAATTHMVRALGLHRAGRFDDASEEFRAGLALDPRSEVRPLVESLMK